MARRVVAMARIEIICPHCKQLNVRYTGWASLFHPILFRQLCSVCGTHLYTAQRDVVDVIFGYLMLFSIYSLHALVGAMLLTVPVLFLVLMFSLEDAWMRTFVLCAMVMGAGVGIWRAQMTRRKGELLDRHKNRGQGL